MPALKRRSVRRRGRPAPPPEPRWAGSVTAADGTRLHVEEHGEPDAAVTAVLLHGWTLDRTTWSRQVAGLSAELDGGLRVLTYDHRGHGRSGRTSLEKATIARLADDLAAVLAERVPAGPVVLAGHSMGGMTVMALAERHPELFAERVAGAVFVATSSGGLDQATYGLPQSLAPWLRRAERLSDRVLLLARRGRGTAGGDRHLGTGDAAPGATLSAPPGGKGLPSTSLLRPGLRWLLFGAKPARADMDRVAASVTATPAESVVGFRSSLGEHDRADALGGCGGLPVVVACGTRDRLCPTPHSRAIAGSIPGSELVLYPGAGHMLPMERPEEITAHIAAVARSPLRAGSHS